MVRSGKLWCVAAALIWCQQAWSIPNYLTAWEAKYPTSTLPARMQATTGSSCHVCHHPPTRDIAGNCYREDLITLLNGGATITEALDQLDAADSDNDGVSNGVEATTARDDQPGEVGYNMGLVGATGTDPCSLEPGVAISGELETPTGPVPAVSTWGMGIMTLLLLVTGTVALRSSPRVQPVRARARFKK